MRALQALAEYLVTAIILPVLALVVLSDWLRGKL